jgi:hypothetical protein
VARLAARKQFAITPPADKFLIFTSCSAPAWSMSLPTRSIDDRRSSVWRSAGRGTAVDSDTVVDSNAAWLPLYV